MRSGAVAIAAPLGRAARALQPRMTLGSVWFRRRRFSVPGETVGATDAPPAASTTGGSPGTGEPDLFVSYSRSDVELVRRIVAALVARGKDVWVDWEDIPPTADWQRKVDAGIEAAKAFVFVISPDSASSKICRREVAHAVEGGKRVVPIVARAVDPRALPEPVATPNWIYVGGEDGFDGSIQTLVDALETDLDWIDAHSRLLVRAVEWEHAEPRAKASTLLRGSELAAAEAWLGQQGSHREVATPLQAAYIYESRRASTRRQRITVGAVSTALVVALALAGVALWQRNQAIDREKTARSRALAATALLDLDVDPATSLALAREAALAKPTHEAEQALRDALVASRLRAVGRIAGDALLDQVVSPDRRTVVTIAEDGTAQAWDTRTRRATTLSRFDRDVYGATFSADSRYLMTIARSGAARLLAVGSWRSVRAWRHVVKPIAVTPGARAVVLSRPDGGSELLGLGIVPWRMPLGDITSADFSPDGRFLVTTLGPPVGPRAAVVRRLGTLRTVARVRGVDAAQFVDDRYLVTEGARGKAGRSFSATGRSTIWHVGSWSRVATLAGSFGAVSSFDAHDLAPWRPGVSAVEGRAFAGRRSRLLFFNGRKATLVDPGFDLVPAMLSGHTAVVRAGDISGDGSLAATVSADTTARLWDAATGVALAVLRGHRDTVEEVAFTPSGRELVTVSDDMTIRFWSVPAVATAAVAPQGQRLAAVGASRTGLFAITAPQPLDSRGLLWANTGVSWSPRSSVGWLLYSTPTFSGNGAYLYAPEGIWTTAPARQIGSFKDANAGAFSPDAQFFAIFASFPSDDKLAVYRVRTRTWPVVGTAPGPLRQKGQSPKALAMSPDGIHAIVGGDSGGSWLVDTRAHRIVLSLAEHADDVTAAAYSPDGTLGATAGVDGRAFIVDARGRLIATFNADAGGIASIAFDPTGSFVVTANADGTARVWDAITGDEVAVLRGARRPLQDATFTADGLGIIAGGRDGVFRMWACEPCRPLPQLIDAATSALPTRLPTHRVR
jgi:WD40 repeat protein